MLIIVEGSEHGGKTTLIDELLKYRPWFIKCKRHTQATWPTNHKLAKDDPAYDPYPTKWDFGKAFFHDWRFFLEAISYDPQGFEKATFVFDRSFITNHIFNDAVWTDHQTPEHIEMLHAYEEKLAQIPHLIVYCKRDVSPDFKDKFTDDCELNYEHWQKFCQSYEKYFASIEGKLNVIKIDNNILTPQEAVNIVLQHVGS